MNVRKPIDFTNDIKVSQAGTNACFYYDGENLYLYVVDRILTSPIIRKIDMKNKKILVETKNNRYIILKKTH
jgi:hypothetical protein